MTTINTDPADRSLRVEQVKLSLLAKRYGTPLYVYSYARLIENYRRIRDAFAAVNPLIAFSMKCNSNAAILRALINEGTGLDIVSGGELARGLATGADPAKIIFAGVGKTREEIVAALRAGIRAFNVESEPEADAIGAVAARLRRPAPIAIRVNPDVDAATHHYITTGRKENKFGIPFDKVRRLFRKLARTRGLRLVGLHCHIGSQILKPDGYIKALGRMAELLARLRADGHAIDLLNLGGGFGIAYEEGQEPMDMKALAAALVPELRKLGVRVIFEPGRSIAGPAGFLLTRVEYVKEGAVKNFAIVDGAMNDLIRPSLYSAFHRILPVEARRGRVRTYDVVGPICESGDFLGKDRQLPLLRAGDLLVVCDAGAYGMAMASNYNSRPRAAEVLVRGGRHHLIRRREKVEDLVAPEAIPAFLNGTGR
ncbi:MAG: diaminopimelate decarboxylase [bacterium]|nr:diaminopimelate decarboxylase [bacterium]